MADYSDYTKWLESGHWIRNSVRLLILDQSRSNLLIEANIGFGSQFYNFIGGGLEVGETLEECLQREYMEELQAEVDNFRFLFVLQNLFTYQSEIRHALEFYFEIIVQSDIRLPQTEDVDYVWIPIEKLASVDLRPVAVRDVLTSGEYANIRHLLNKDSL